MEYRHGEKKVSGVVVPLSAIRTATSPGCGEYPDLAAFGRLASGWRLDLVQLLPIQDTGVQTSPYSALSAFALHPLFIRIQDLPELRPDSATSSVLSIHLKAEILGDAEDLFIRHSGAETVSHEKLLEAKLVLLERIWKGGVQRSRTNELDFWIKKHPWIRNYAVFVELKRRNKGLPWWQWSDYRHPEPSDIDALWNDPEYAGNLRWHAWMQMRADEQLGSAAKSLADAGIELMGDIPILMNEDSTEVWADRNLFRMGSIAGAPPDMYSALGQNWGFPIYNWEAQAADGFGFWKSRLRASDAYYSAFRIDHVLGFFRIWALSEHDRSGYLGHFVPELPVRKIELSRFGLGPDRLKWLSQPHLRTAWLLENLPRGTFGKVVESALERIGIEELFLFKSAIRGEKDIRALDIDEASKDVLEVAWRDRALYEFEPESFVRTWYHTGSAAWASLSDEEKRILDRLFSQRKNESDLVWARDGETILRELAGSVPMLACAEDLGAVPACVPATLEKLGILGLRVLRWTRKWEESGSPYVAPADYPLLTVACPSVHDSTCLREWWEKEAERRQVWDWIAAWLSRDTGPCPETLDGKSLFLVLAAIAGAGSRMVVYPIQDLLALSEVHRNPDPSAERINVPGTTGGRNWAYRMHASVEDLERDSMLTARIARISGIRG